MPKVSTTPETLRPFVCHGLVPEYEDGDKEAMCQCPFCGREKFSIKVETGEWRCFVCQEGTRKGGGNIYTFMRLLHKFSMETTRRADHAEYAENRRLLDPSTLAAWGVCKSATTGQWLCPGYSPDGKLNQLYRYVRQADGSHHWYLTAGISHHVHGVPLFEPTRPTVYVAEGISDGMALWEAMSLARRKGKSQAELTLASGKGVSLLSEANVLAVPGAATFSENWNPLFSGKRVVLLYDNDHPKVNAGPDGKAITTEPAGYQGLKRACSVLASASPPTGEVAYLKWWDGDGNHNPKLPRGFDVRDFLSTGDCLPPKGEVGEGGGKPCPVSDRAGRVALLGRLLGKVVPAPKEWLVPAKKAQHEDLQPRPCSSWEELVYHWRRAMKWTEGLDRALSVMLACVMSTENIGDQLWVQVCSPPGSGKTSLADAIGVARRYVLCKDVIRGFHSGYKVDKEGSEDTSLIARLRDKTLITKDGDTLLKSPNVDQILSEARALYDGTTTASYRNNLNREYKDVRMTWILCGTSSLLKLDSSELGARFLTCIIMSGIDDELEDDVLHRVAYRTLKNMGQIANGKVETRRDADMVTAMQLTGGYVMHLRQNAGALLEAVEVTDDQVERVIALGKLVAHLRARPSKGQDEVAEREIGTRLVSQLLRLTTCLAAVLGKRTADAEVMRRVLRVGTDTARGRSMEICKFLHDQGEDGAEVGEIAAALMEQPEKTRPLLNFLAKIDAVKVSHRGNGPSARGRRRYRLTDKLVGLYEQVFTAG